MGIILGAPLTNFMEVHGGHGVTSDQDATHNVTELAKFAPHVTYQDWKDLFPAWHVRVGRTCQTWAAITRLAGLVIPRQSLQGRQNLSSLNGQNPSDLSPTSLRKF